MKVALADLPWPFLVEPRPVAQSDGGAWHDLETVAGEAGLGAALQGCDMPSVLRFLSALITEDRKRLQSALHSRDRGVADPRLLKPIDPLAKILLTEGRVALSRSNDDAPARMVVGFSKLASALADPEGAVLLPEPGAHYDVEAALAAVLGEATDRVDDVTAARRIVGFTLMAEVTHRDMFEAEWRTSNSLFAKNCRALSPLGPAIWIGGIEELDPATEITLAVNGATRQRFTVADFAHSFAAATSAWSRCVLEPGDMVALGAAIARPRPDIEIDSPIPIAAGDRIEVSAAPIGTLRARFVA